MTNDVDALIGLLREDVGFDGQKLLAADALSSQAERIKQQALDYVSLFDQCSEQAERIQALEAKCALLAASLAQEEKRSAQLEGFQKRYKYMEDRFIGVDFEWSRAEDGQGHIPVLLIQIDENSKAWGDLALTVDAAIAAQAGSKEGA